MRSVTSFIGPVCLMLCWASAYAEEVAERPHWRIGDKWTYRAVSEPPRQESTWSREVVKTLPNNRYAVVSETGSRQVFDDSANGLDKRGPEYSWRRFQFPMSVGMSWKHEHKIGGEAWSGNEQSSWHVRAFEHITVPAGSFDCFRVEGEAFRGWHDMREHWQSALHGYTHTIYWYCPAVKGVARWEIINQAWVQAPRITTVSELVSYQAGE